MGAERGFGFFVLQILSLMLVFGATPGGVRDHFWYRSGIIPGRAQGVWGALGAVSELPTAPWDTISLAWSCFHATLTHQWGLCSRFQLMQKPFGREWEGQ